MVTGSKGQTPLLLAHVAQDGGQVQQVPGAEEGVVLYERVVHRHLRVDLCPLGEADLPVHFVNRWEQLSWI
jgi:hypothetical protein